MKTDMIVDFDTRRVLFKKIVASLDLMLSAEAWDLNWGEPFLAVTQDRLIWVRIFYEETLPLSSEKLMHEIERLRPHLLPGAALCLCVPESGRQLAEDLLLELSFPVRVWNYSGSENNEVVAREIVRKVPSVKVTEVNEAFFEEQKHPLDQRLSTEEVRELAEMGLAVKRGQWKKTASCCI